MFPLCSDREIARCKILVDPVHEAARIMYIPMEKGGFQRDNSRLSSRLLRLKVPTYLFDTTTIVCQAYFCQTVNIVIRFIRDHVGLQPSKFPNLTLFETGSTTIQCSEISFEKANLMWKWQIGVQGLQLHIGDHRTRVNPCPPNKRWKLCPGTV